MRAYGWRIPFLLSALFTPLGVWLLRHSKESTVFTNLKRQESRRRDEAAAETAAALAARAEIGNPGRATNDGYRELPGHTLANPAAAKTRQPGGAGGGRRGQFIAPGSAPRSRCAARCRETCDGCCYGGLCGCCADDAADGAASVAVREPACVILCEHGPRLMLMVLTIGSAGANFYFLNTCVVIESFNRSGRSG